VIDAVIFDWGGTLTPWRVIDHRQAWRAYAAALHAGDATRAEGVADALHAAEQARCAIARDVLRSFRTEQVLADVGVPWHEGAIAAYREYWTPYTHTDPDAGPLLAALRLRGLRVGVLSSTPWPAEWHAEILRRDGVLDAVHGAVWSSSLQWTKPHAEAFAAAMAAVEVDDPRRCVYVGDRMYDDVHGAAMLGMRTIFVPHSAIPDGEQLPVDVTPDAVVQRLADVLDVVDRWIGEPR
jgi:FMN hydrolase / 5-amino-6-(5-phospho-D-ribitylamino)uracil phosphatase